MASPPSLSSSSRPQSRPLQVRWALQQFGVFNFLLLYLYLLQFVVFYVQLSPSNLHKKKTRKCFLGCQSLTGNRECGLNCQITFCTISNDLVGGDCKKWQHLLFCCCLYLDLAEFSPKDLYLFNLILDRVSAVVPDAINNNYGQFSCACNNSTCC